MSGSKKRTEVVGTTKSVEFTERELQLLLNALAINAENDLEEAEVVEELEALQRKLRCAGGRYAHEERA